MEDYLFECTNKIFSLALLLQCGFFTNGFGFSLIVAAVLKNCRLLQENVQIVLKGSENSQPLFNSANELFGTNPSVGRVSVGH